MKLCASLPSISSKLTIMFLSSSVILSVPEITKTMQWDPGEEAKKHLARHLKASVVSSSMPLTPGVSTTKYLVSLLTENSDFHSVVTEEKLCPVSKTFFPSILFPSVLFPEPTLPMRIIRISFSLPIKQFNKKKHCIYIIFQT